MTMVFDLMNWIVLMLINDVRLNKYILLELKYTPTKYFVLIRQKSPKIGEWQT